MKIFELILAGVAGGILSGMGFGGGTLLIPILTFFFGVAYPIATWTNLVVFLPAGIVALAYHVKHGMVEIRPVVFMLTGATVGVATGALLSGKISDEVLKRVFGLFLISLGSISLLSVLIGYIKRKTKK